MGAYLESISVQGFRGIGPKVTVPLPPGPGLLVIAGRNGSGKSTLAEALEFALTGVNSRWQDKATVWSQNWRNLHQGEPAEIRVGLTEQGSGPTTIGVDWSNGDDVKVDDYKAWVQRDGNKREDPSALGWSAALEMYRPLLSYDELGGILEGRPSDFYDQLYKLLGLEQLTEAMARLDARGETAQAAGRRGPQGPRRAQDPAAGPRGSARGAGAGAGVEAQAGSGCGAAVDHRRGRRLFRRRGSVRPPRRHPLREDVAEACAALRTAAAGEREEVRHSDALAVDRGRLLETGSGVPRAARHPVVPRLWAGHPRRRLGASGRAPRCSRSRPPRGRWARPDRRCDGPATRCANSWTL